MALRLAIGAVVAPALRRAVARGQQAILRSVAIALAVTAGTVLLLVSALLALSAWIGPIAATGIGGLSLLMAAGIAALVWRGQHRPLPGRSKLPAADPGITGPMLLSGMTIVVGFALLSRLLGKHH
jgi:hypothetical protein